MGEPGILRGGEKCSPALFPEREIASIAACPLVAVIWPAPSAATSDATRGPPLIRRCGTTFDVFWALEATALFGRVSADELVESAALFATRMALASQLARPPPLSHRGLVLHCEIASQ